MKEKVLLNLTEYFIFIKVKNILLSKTIILEINRASKIEYITVN